MRQLMTSHNLIIERADLRGIPKQLCIHNECKLFTDKYMGYLNVICNGNEYVINSCFSKGIVWDGIR